MPGVVVLALGSGLALDADAGAGAKFADAGVLAARPQPRRLHHRAVAAPRPSSLLSDEGKGGEPLLVGEGGDGLGRVVVDLGVVPRLPRSPKVGWEEKRRFCKSVCAFLSYFLAALVQSGRIKGFSKLA